MGNGGPRRRETISEVSIYTLTDPRTDQIRYVGMTSLDLKTRLGQHIYTVRWSKARQTHLRAWLTQVVNSGHEPVIALIELVAVADWQDREKYWISLLKLDGCDLVNGTAGGDGMVGRVVTAEQRKASSDRQRGKPRPPHVVAIMQAASIKARQERAKAKPKKSKADPKKSRQLQSEARQRFWDSRTTEERSQIVANMRAKSDSEEKTARHLAAKLAGKGYHYDSNLAKQRSEAGKRGAATRARNRTASQAVA